MLRIKLGGFVELADGLLGRAHPKVCQGQLVVSFRVFGHHLNGIPELEGCPRVVLLVKETLAGFHEFGSLLSRIRATRKK